MKLIKATVLAKTLGISRRTVADWCARDPDLAVRKGRDYWIRLDELAKRPGMDLIKAFSLSEPWIRATDLARMANLPRRTLAYWCKTRPWLARRIGRIWYISPDALAATPEQADFLAKWAPQQRTACALVKFSSESGSNAHG